MSTSKKRSRFSPPFFSDEPAETGFLNFIKPTSMHAFPIQGVIGQDDKVLPQGAEQVSLGSLIQQGVIGQDGKVLPPEQKLTKYEAAEILADFGIGLPPEQKLTKYEAAEILANLHEKNIVNLYRISPKTLIALRNSPAYQAEQKRVLQEKMRHMDKGKKKTTKRKKRKKPKKAKKTRGKK